MTNEIEREKKLRLANLLEEKRRRKIKPENPFDVIDRLVGNKSFDLATRWCENTVCGCMGCANGTGELNHHGITKEDWEAWLWARVSAAIGIDDAGKR